MAAIRHRHILEQHPEIRLIHAKLRLHRLRRQPRLAPHDAAAFSLPQTRVDLLNRIGPIRIHRIKISPQRRDSTTRIGGAQKTGGGFKCFGHMAPNTSAAWRCFWRHPILHRNKGRRNMASAI